MAAAFFVRFLTFPPTFVRIGTIVKKWQPFFKIQNGGDRYLEFRWMCIFDATVAFYGRFSTFPSNLVRIGLIVKKWQQIFEIQDGGGSHLEKYTSGWTATMRKELLVCNFSQKANFRGVILTFKSCLLSRALMLKRFLLQIGQVQKRVKILMFFGPETHLKWIWRLQTLIGTSTKQNTSFELLNVRIGPELRPVGEMRKRKKGRTKVTKLLHFTTVWRRPLGTDINQIWCVCRSYQRY